MGTSSSVALNEVVRRGRAAVNDGLTTDEAYFEWSADPKADPGSPDTWRSCMPALGYTVTEDVVRHAFATMSRPEFLRAFLNIPTHDDSVRLWSPELWASACSPHAESSGATTLGLDMDHTGLALAFVGGGVAELLDPPPTAANVVELVAAAAAKRSAVVGIDKAGLAAQFIPALEAAGVTVVAVAGQDMARACASIDTAVKGGAIRFRADSRLTAAATAAATLPKGDGAWVWGRKTSAASIAPLVAVTIAAWVAATTPHVDPLSQIH
jgi:phage terminase large subunit-like protein